MTPLQRLHSMALTSGDVVRVDRNGVARVWTPPPVKPVSLAKPLHERTWE